MGLNTLMLVLSDDLSTLVTASPALTIRALYAMSITNARSNLKTASSSGTVVVDILVGGTSIFGATKLTIDSSSKTSVGSTSPITIANPTVADDAEITFNITSAGTNASGLKVVIYY
jgi:hypothetical protein